MMSASGAVMMTKVGIPMLCQAGNANKGGTARVYIACRLLHRGDGLFFYHIRIYKFSEDPKLQILIGDKNYH
jgi:hypothetical protein